MNQGQNQHLHKDGGIIGMANVPKWASRDDPERGGVHDLDVPVFSESANDPPANRIGSKKYDEADSAEQRDEWTMKQYNFKSGTNQYRSVQKDHPEEAGIVHFASTVGDHALLVLAGNAQLEDAQERNDDEQQEV